MLLQRSQEVVFSGLVLAAGDTKPSDATLDDFRAMRALVNKAALNGRLSAYYLDTTWETRLPAFRAVIKDFS